MIVERPIDFVENGAYTSHSIEKQASKAIVSFESFYKYQEFFINFFKQLSEKFCEIIDFILDFAIYLIAPPMEESHRFGKEHFFIPPPENVSGVETTSVKVDLVARVPMGIENPEANLCYLIAPIQSFFNHPSFKSYLLDAYKALEKSIDLKSPTDVELQPIRKEVIKLLTDWYEKYPILKPRGQANYALKLRQLACKLSPDIKKGIAQFQDTGEIILIVLDALGYRLQVKETICAKTDRGEFKKESMKTPITFLEAHFKPGKLILQELIDREYAIEKFEDDFDNKYKIEEEGWDKISSPNWSKQKTIVSPKPEMLVLQLNRHDKATHSKDYRKVQFPEDDIVDFSKLFESFAKYRVSSVVVHTGVHYISYVKKDGVWFLCNDSSVYPVKDSHADRSGSYFVFLEPIDEKATSHS